MCTCNPSTPKPEQEDHKFEASLDNIARLCLKEKEKEKNIPKL
jgi:hypothetical protein